MLGIGFSVDTHTQSQGTKQILRGLQQCFFFTALSPHFSQRNLTSLPSLLIESPSLHNFLDIIRGK